MREVTNETYDFLRSRDVQVILENFENIKILLAQLTLVRFTLNQSAMLCFIPTKSCLFICNIVVYIVRNIVHDR